MLMRFFSLFFVAVFFQLNCAQAGQDDRCAKLHSILTSSQSGMQQSEAIKQLLSMGKLRCDVCEMFADSFLDQTGSKASISHIAFLKPDCVYTLSFKRGHIDAVTVYTPEQYTQWCAQQKKIAAIESFFAVH